MKSTKLLCVGLFKIYPKTRERERKKRGTEKYEKYTIKTMSKEFLLLSNLRISKVLEYSRQKILTRKLSFKNCYNKRTMHTNCMNGNLLYRILNTQSSIFPYTQQYKVKVCCRINEFRYVRLALITKQQPEAYIIAVSEEHGSVSPRPLRKLQTDQPTN